MVSAEPRLGFGLEADDECFQAMVVGFCAFRVRDD
jgi:hypothetical protein